MGVKGLWQLLEPVGRPVTLESLENKILGVDASLMLNQSIKGMRDRHGNPVPNAHLVGLFNRICKLLYYRIKPVFVFDGGVPHLKKKTLARRKEIRFKAIHGSNIAAERIVKNVLKAKALETVTGKRSSSNVRSRSPREPDVFELSPLPENTNMENQREDEEMDLPLLDQFRNQDLEETFQNPDSININSEDFKALPPEIQHELIKEMKEEGKWQSSSNLPKRESDFSQFQLDGVLQRGKMNQRLDELRKEMSQRNSGELAGVASHDSLGDNSTVMSQKILSEETAHYILIKGNEQTKDQSKKETHNDGIVRDFSGEGGFFRKDQDCEIISWTTSRPKPPSETKIPSFDIPDFVSSDSETLSPFLDVPEAAVSPTSPPVKRNLFHFSNAKQTACEREAFAKMENNPWNESQKQKVEKCSRSAATNENEAKTDQLRGSELDVICVEEYARNREDQLLSQIIDKKKELDNLIKKWEESKNVDRTSKGDISIDNHQRISSVHKEIPEDIARSLDRETAGDDLEKQQQLINSSTGSTSTNMVEVCSEALLGIDSARNVTADKELNYQGVVRVCDSDDGSVEEIQPSALRGDNEVIKGRDTGDSKQQMEGKLNSVESSAVNVETIRPESVSEKPAATIANTATNKRDSDCKEDITSCKEQYLDTKNIFVTEDEKQSDEKQLGTAVEASGNDGNADENQPNKNNEEDQESLEEQTVVVDSESDEQSDENRIDSADEVAIIADATTDTITDDQKGEEDIEKTIVLLDQEAGPPRLPSEWQGASVEDLTEIQHGLESEQKSLASEQARQERIAATVSNEMYTECQELLQLFGVPFLVSPMEAEAQCATLDILNLTEGSITDDSDIFLFGGRRVYKNIFNQNKHAEMYASDSVKSMFALDRPNLICLAFITGSDYTEGIQGVGVVGAMEIIHEFTGEGLEGLKKFKRWHDEVQQQTKLPQETKVKKRLRSVPLPLGFPSDEVYEAYLSPVVDESTESFEWGKPDLHALRLFASDKFGWSSSRTDELLLPVLKQLNRDQTQMKINQYFDVKFQEARAVKSKRLRQVLNRKFHPSNSSSNSGNENEKLKSRKGGSKKIGKARKDRHIGEMERTSSKNENEEDGISEENTSESLRVAREKGTRRKRKVEKSKAGQSSFTADGWSGSEMGPGRVRKVREADKHAVLNLEATVKLTPVKGFRVLPMASKTSLLGASGQEAQATSETASDEIILAKSTSESCQTKTIDAAGGARRKRSNSEEQTSQPKRANYVRSRGKGRGFTTKAQAQPSLVDSRREEDSSSDSSSLSDEDCGNYYDGPKPVSVFHRGRGRGRGSRRGRGR